MTVIPTSGRKLSRLWVMVDLTDGRLAAAAAASLMGAGRRQVFRLRQAFATAGPAGLMSKKRGRPSSYPLQHGVIRGRLAEMGRQAAIVLYVVAMAAVIVGLDFAFFRNRFWERLAVNIGVVLVFGVFYLRFLKNP
jgi:hypothetical protein